MLTQPSAEYTPAMVRRNLRTYRYTLGARPPLIPEHGVIIRSSRPGAAEYDAADRRAEIDLALRWLGMRAPIWALAIRMYYLDEEQYRQRYIAAHLTRRLGRPIYQYHVSRMIDRGIEQMANYLRGELAQDA